MSRAKIIEKIRSKFRSGNCVPVERNYITREEYLEIEQIISENKIFTPEMIQELVDSCNLAMHNAVAARIPECGDFGKIAQSLSYIIQEINVKEK